MHSANIEVKSWKVKHDYPIDSNVIIQVCGILADVRNECWTSREVRPFLREFCKNILIRYAEDDEFWMDDVEDEDIKGWTRDAVSKLVDPRVF